MPHQVALNLTGKALSYSIVTGLAVVLKAVDELDGLVEKHNLHMHRPLPHWKDRY